MRPDDGKSARIALRRRRSAESGAFNMRDSRRGRAELINRSGLHLRAAGLVVEVSQQFQSRVRVMCNGVPADGRSILDLMLLGAECGSLLELEATGPDAEDAVAALSTLIQDGFYEGESSLDDASL
jgi:phosphocarrier protein